MCIATITGYCHSGYSGRQRADLSVPEGKASDIDWVVYLLCSCNTEPPGKQLEHL